MLAPEKALVRIYGPTGGVSGAGFLTAPPPSPSAALLPRPSAAPSWFRAFMLPICPRYDTMQMVKKNGSWLPPARTVDQGGAAPWRRKYTTPGRPPQGWAACAFPNPTGAGK